MTKKAFWQLPVAMIVAGIWVGCGSVGGNQARDTPGSNSGTMPGGIDLTDTIDPTSNVHGGSGESGADDSSTASGNSTSTICDSIEQTFAACAGASDTTATDDAATDDPATDDPATDDPATDAPATDDTGLDCDTAIESCSTEDLALLSVWVDCVEPYIATCEEGPMEACAEGMLGLSQACLAALSTDAESTVEDDAVDIDGT